MKSPMVKYVFFVSYWIVTIAALNIGLTPLLTYDPMARVLDKIGMGMMVVPLQYIVGVAAVISLLGLLGMKGGNCHCQE